LTIYSYQWNKRWKWGTFHSCGAANISLSVLTLLNFWSGNIGWKFVQLLLPRQFATSRTKTLIAVWWLQFLGTDSC
jgi:hypothetical protein